MQRKNTMQWIGSNLYFKYWRFSSFFISLIIIVQWYRHRNTSENHFILLHPRCHAGSIFFTYLVCFLDICTTEMFSLGILSVSMIVINNQFKNSAVFSPRHLHTCTGIWTGHISTLHRCPTSTDYNTVLHSNLFTCLTFFGET